MNDDAQWGAGRNQNQGGRNKQSGQGNYSPSASYNYNQNGQSRGQNYYHPVRRRTERSGKKNGNNSSEKLIRQNDVIIKLLKEIRDRLPAVKELNQFDESSESQQETCLTNENQDFEQYDSEAAASEESEVEVGVNDQEDKTESE